MAPRPHKPVADPSDNFGSMFTEPDTVLGTASFLSDTSPLVMTKVRRTLDLPDRSD